MAMQNSNHNIDLVRRCTLSFIDSVALLLSTVLALHLPTVILLQDEYSLFYKTMLVTGILCIFWFWNGLRHYIYRKGFWNELKDILKTVFVFALLQQMLMAYFGSTPFAVWVKTWALAGVLIPLGRYVVKMGFNRFGLWAKLRWLSALVLMPKIF